MFLTSPTGIQDNEKMENTTTYQVVEIMPHNNMIFELSWHSPLKSVGLLHSCEVYDVMMHNDEQERCKRCVVTVRAFRTGDWLHSDAMSYFLNIMKRQGIIGNILYEIRCHINIFGSWSIISFWKNHDH